MRAKVEEQQRARRLRAAGLSVRAIARELDVSQGSVSVWVRDVPLSDEQRAALQSHMRPKPSPFRRERAPLGASGMTRRCSKCRETLPIEAFNRSGDDWQWYCRDCFGAYFRQRGAKHREQTTTAARRRVEAARRMVAEHLARHPCADCGEVDPLVLEFDHLRDKLVDVSQLVAAGLIGRLAEELPKCEVVCVNCHRRRTATRGRWVRATRVLPARWSMSQRLGTLAVWDRLLRHGCLDCGEAELMVLDFDHRRDKVGSPSVMAVTARPLVEIYEEMAKCEVRCGNCHRRRTAVSRGWWKAGAAV